MNHYYLISKFGLALFLSALAIISTRAQVVRLESNVVDHGFYLTTKTQLSLSDDWRLDYRVIRQLGSDSLIIKVRNTHITPGRLGIVKIKNENWEWKLSPRLRAGGLDEIKGSSDFVVLLDSKDVAEAISDLTIWSSPDGPISSRTFAVAVRCTIDSLKAFVLSRSEVLHVDLNRTNRSTLQEESLIRIHNLAANKINLVHHIYSELQGLGSTISVKEKSVRPDDIDLMNRTFETSLRDQEYSAHATDMATLIAGAGNSFITGRGVSNGALITSASFSNTFPEMASYYTTNSITTQNHSYGVGVEGGYGPEAMAFDMLSMSIPELVQVFSAGNSGQSPGGIGNYLNLPNLSNLTGNFKHAKNNIVVTGANEKMDISPTHSRGPAFDGRVKPEITAFGGEGTSEAAALVSGSVAMIQQLFKDIHNYSPRSSMIKSILFASAEEVGSVGPDYISGYGSLDLYQSIEVVNQGQIISDSIDAFDSKTYPITVENGVKDLRVAISWIDPAANAGDFTALINNLDLRLSLQGQTWKPWVLSTVPNADSLLAPAVRGNDHLNNTELITLSNPAMGTYLLEVQSNELSDTQHFDIAWNIEVSNNFLWTYPMSSDKIEAGKISQVRWSQSFTGQLGQLEISYGDGWQCLAKDLALTNNYWEWSVPDTVSLATLRMQIGNDVYLSDTFSISREMRLRTGLDCEESYLLEWDVQENIGSYRVYSLGQNYLSPVLDTSLTYVEFSKALRPAKHYAIRPILNGIEGLGSPTIDYSAISTGCHFTDFRAVQVEKGQALLTLDLSSIVTVQNVEIRKSYGFSENVLASLDSPDSTRLQFFDMNLEQGVNTYRAVLTLKDQSKLTSDDVSIASSGSKVVLIFPNPVGLGKALTISTSEMDPIMFIYDTFGHLVASYQILGTSDVVETVDLKTGLYILRIVGEDGKVIVSERLLIQ